MNWGKKENIKLTWTNIIKQKLIHFCYFLFFHYYFNQAIFYNISIAVKLFTLSHTAGVIEKLIINYSILAIKISFSFFNTR